MGKVKIFFRALLIFLGTLLVMVAIEFLLMVAGLTITKDPASSIQQFIERLYPILASLLLIFWSKRYKPKLYNRILYATRLTKDNFISLGRTIVLVLSILYLFFVISGLLNEYQFIHFGIKEYSYSIILKRSLLVGILGNIFVAIGEEIIFRGFLLNYIADVSKSKWFALLFTSFVFSLHLYPDFLNYAIVFLFGLTAGYAYLKFKTLYIPIGIHFAYNVFNFTIASAPRHGPQLPYVVKFDYLMIKDGFGAWVDLSIILGFLVIFWIIWKKPSSNKQVLGSTRT